MKIRLDSIHSMDHDIHRVESTNYRRCLVCGYEWVRRDKSKDPKRCPNQECRSKQWNGAGLALNVTVVRDPLNGNKLLDSPESGILLVGVTGWLLLFAALFYVISWAESRSSGSQVAEANPGFVLSSSIQSGVANLYAKNNLVVCFSEQSQSTLSRLSAAYNGGSLFLNLTQSSQGERSKPASNPNAENFKSKDYPVSYRFRWAITLFGAIVFGYFLGQAHFYSGRIARWILLLGFLCGLAVFNYGLYLIVKFGEYL